MDRVSSEFYKNVLLLTKFVTPHDDFKKHFREGMFDKPNTLGFIHVSYYLLNVHYKDKLKIQWPVICKQTENKFRNDVKEYLMTVASENPDLNFPPIFASHLLLAKSNKFLLIMWKFSLVVLRTFLKTEHRCVLASNPKSGPCSDLTKVFLTDITDSNKNAVSIISKNKDDIQEEAVHFLTKKSEKQNLLKAEILILREKLKKVINNAPVNATAKENLSVIEDNEIISMWINSINNIQESSNRKLELLKDEHVFLKSILNIVSIIKGDLAILNAKSLDPIDIDSICQIVSQEMQVLCYNLYSQGSLNLQNFFKIFIFLLQKFEAHCDKNDTKKFPECKKQLEMSNEDLKIAISQLQNLSEEINNSHLSDVKKIDELDDTHKVISNVPEFDRVLFMSSPSININSVEGGSNFNQNYLQLTPVEGAHKELFSRHALNGENLLSAKKPLLVQRINFDDSLTFESSRLDYNNTVDKQSLFRSRSTLKNVDKYSKVFSSRSRNPDNKANKSIMSMMLPLMAKQHSISLVDSCNSSQDISQNSLLINPNLSSTVEPSKAGEKENEVQKSQKRRSIGDLVERYKKILQERDSK